MQVRMQMRNSTIVAERSRNRQQGRQIRKQLALARRSVVDLPALDNTLAAIDQQYPADPALAT